MTAASERSVAEAPTCIVLLPGAGNAAQDFETAGFGAAVHARGLPVELVPVELEFSHLTDRSVLERLRRGPCEAARAAGHRAVWLAGVSLGGFVALAFAERYPGELDGLCLIAPYLGTRLVTGEIGRAGGLACWNAGAVADDDEERRIWCFIQARLSRPSIFLGYGSEDRFADSQRLLAAALPPASVVVVDGGHEWPVWRRVWELFLDRWPAPARGSSGGPAV
jgi:pimeloyl-ACP methyl ester carboxylesterase